MSEREGNTREGKRLTIDCPGQGRPLEVTWGEREEKQLWRDSNRPCDLKDAAVMLSSTTPSHRIYGFIYLSIYFCQVAGFHLKMSNNYEDTSMG